MPYNSNKGNEPPHIHVQEADKYARVWLKPIQVAESIGYTSKELRHVQDIITEHLELLLEAWYEHFV